MYSTDKELLKILVDYSDDLATLKMREGRLPAQAAIHRILALLNNAVVAELEHLRDLPPRVVHGSILNRIYELTKEGHNSGKDN